MLLYWFIFKKSITTNVYVNQMSSLLDIIYIRLITRVSVKYDELFHE